MTPRAGAVLAPLSAAIAIASALVASPTRAPAQPTRAGRGQAYVADVGPGLPGRVLRELLSAPHDVLVAPDTGLTLGREATFARTLVVVGGPTRVAATVHGDLVVLGELFMRPGARIDGRAVAFGGGAYNSALAVVRGGVSEYRDAGFDGAPDPITGALALSYRPAVVKPSPFLTLPGVYGVRIPTYTRVDGLGVTVGPELALRGGRARIEPTLTYRSHIGAFDPSVHAIATFGRRTGVDLLAARGTLTNDAWRRGDLTNSIVTIGTGGDARNYYRADRVEATVSHRFETGDGDVEPFVGALAERSWSIARRAADPVPYSMFGSLADPEGIRRPNPAVTGGRIGSALAGVRVRIQDAGVSSSLSARAEVAPFAPDHRRFAQITADGIVAFTAFGSHIVGFGAHVVATRSDSTPSQRYAYLGGGPSIPSILLDSLGGDRLFWTETRYSIPLRKLALPFVGPPRIMFRHLLGGAGVGTFGGMTQNVGFRLAVGPLRVDFTFDPARAGTVEWGASVGYP